MSDVQVDIVVTFGARVKAGYSLIVTFSSEFIRNDKGDIVCSIVSGTTELSKTCTTVTSTPGIISSIAI